MGLTVLYTCTFVCTHNTLYMYVPCLMRRVLESNISRGTGESGWNLCSNFIFSRVWSQSDLSSCSSCDTTSTYFFKHCSLLRHTYDTQTHIRMTVVYMHTHMHFYLTTAAPVIRHKLPFSNIIRSYDTRTTLKHTYDNSLYICIYTHFYLTTAAPVIRQKLPFSNIIRFYDTQTHL